MEQMQLALKLSPVSVIVYACDYYDMKNFGTGVFKRHIDNCTDTEFVHSVTVIGYGTTDRGEEYWEVKNSYSDTWGTAGYMKLARNVSW